MILAKWRLSIIGKQLEKDMVKKNFFKLFNKLASKLKDQTYVLDPSLSILSIINYSLRRFISVLRCFWRGVFFFTKPKGLLFVGPQVVLHNLSYITFGRYSTIGRGVMIDGLSQQGIKIGERVSIGSHTTIRCTAVLNNIGKGFTIGDNSSMDSYSFIGAAGGVEIGKNVIMGTRVGFYAENHIFDRTDVPIKNQGTTRKGIIVEDDCWIGANVIFLDGSCVGKGSVIGAGSIVRGKIPPYSVAVGAPARVIRKRKD